MAWWRKCPPQQPSTTVRDEELDRKLTEAHGALLKAQAQNQERQSIGKRIREIREKNHLSEIWGDQGMRA